MLDIVVRKVEQLRQSVVFHGKYIEKFDALSLSSLDVDDRGRVSGTVAEMPGISKLIKDLNNILNEGHITRQEHLCNIKKDLKRCIKIQYTLLQHNNSANTQSVKLESFDEEDGIVLANDQPIEISLLEQELKNQLKMVYESISDTIEEKLLIIRLIKDMLNTYEANIVNIGSESGVLNAAKKAKWVLLDRTSNIYRHNIFVVEEENEMLNKVKEIWAMMYLGNIDHQLIAEKHLSMVLHSRKNEELDWKFYMKIGGIFVLLGWAISECIHNENIGTYVWRDPTFAIFMCIGDLLLLLLMWGVSMHVWKNAGVDFMRLLNLQDSDLQKCKSPVATVFKSLSADAIIFLLTFITFNKILRNVGVHHYILAIAHSIPVLMALYFGYRMLHPWHLRKHWLYMLWKVLTAPFYEVEFRDGYIGDLLTSLVRVSVPFVFSVVYVLLSLVAWIKNDMDWAVHTSDKWWTGHLIYTVGVLPFFTIFPLWIRLVQCLRRMVETGHRWPHMMNGLKYATAIVVIAYGTFQPSLRSTDGWIVSFVGATIFQFLWDVFQDWGILQITMPETQSMIEWLEKLPQCTLRMRSKRLLGPAWVYLLVMLFNLALRFAWTLTLLPEMDAETGSISLYSSLINHAAPVVAAGEIIRRMVWGFFRLEYEQIELIKKTNFENLSDMMQFDHSFFDKMDISSQGEEREVSAVAFQMVGQQDDHPSSSSSHASSSSSSDWTAYLPQCMIDCIQSSFVSASWTSKIRFIESVIFAALIVYSIVSAALPAVATHS